MSAQSRQIRLFIKGNCSYITSARPLDPYIQQARHCAEIVSVYEQFCVLAPSKYSADIANINDQISIVS